jgi:regulator of sigma E protease
MLILIALLVLGFLIFMHELGHFTVAKLSGMPVDEFSLGFGPRLAGFRKAETVYSLRLLPVGGYVNVGGMLPNDERSNGFNRKPLSSRMAVIAAGSVSNFLVSVLLFILTLSIIGIPIASTSNRIGDVGQGSPAAHAGLQRNDRILAIDGEATPTWDAIRAAMQAKGAQPRTLQIERDHKISTISVTPIYNKDDQAFQIGIAPAITYWQRQSLPSSIINGLDNALDLTRLILQSLLGLVTGSIPVRQLQGPVGIVQGIGESAQYGLGSILMTTGMLGINLAIFNILPIPFLDGSRLVFLILEGMRGRPLNPDKENLIHLVGLAMLICLVLFITYNDIVRLFSGG